MPRAASVMAAAVAGAAVSAVIVVGLRHSSDSNRPRRTSAGQATTTTQLSAAGLTAARTLQDLLVQDQQNRSTVQGATEQIAACEDVEGAVTALRQRAAFRSVLLSELARLDLGALPDASAMVPELRAAWQYSMSSDDSYASWGQDEAANCTPDDYADPNFTAAQRTDSQATAAKRAFVARWNAEAPAYGLVQWQAGQL